MGETQPGGHVRFDFDGSLALARRLWVLADELEAEDRGREVEFDAAVGRWRGAHGNEFRNRREIERTSRGHVAAGLRDDAHAWARAWAAALDQQNKNNRAAAVERAREERNLLEKGWDATFGKDDSEQEVPVPSPVRVPAPPRFAPTATEMSF